MIACSASAAWLFFGSSERTLASNRSGGTGEKPTTVRTNRIPPATIITGSGRWTLQRTYFFTSSKTQSCCCAACQGRTNKNRIVHMKSPAKTIPIAIRAPSCEKPIDPLKINARNPTAVVSAPKNTARPSFATDVAIACSYCSPSIRAC